MVPCTEVVPDHLLPIAATVTVDTCNMDHIRGVMSYMIPIIKSGVFNNLTVVCSDGSVSTSVCVFGIIFPSMRGALASGDTDVLLLPQHTVAEVCALCSCSCSGVAATCGLPPAPGLLQLHPAAAVHQLQPAAAVHQLQPAAAVHKLHPTAAVHQPSLSKNSQEEWEEEEEEEQQEVSLEELVEVQEEEDYDYLQPEGYETDSDTEVLEEELHLPEELRSLKGCHCCTPCTATKGKGGRPPAPFDSLQSSSGKVRRVTKRLQGLAQPPLTCPVEGQALMTRLLSDFPEVRASPVLHLSWMTLIKILRLSFNQVMTMMML